MTTYKTLSLSLIALLFVAFAAPNAAPNAKPSKSMDMARSDLDVSDIPGRSINPSNAKNCIGRRMTVCGVVTSANYDARSIGRPTYLFLDEPYPRHIFMALIWGKDREKFGTPETLKGKHVCVFGVIEEYRGVPQIVLRYADQLAQEVD